MNILRATGLVLAVGVVLLTGLMVSSRGKHTAAKPAAAPVPQPIAPPLKKEAPATPTAQTDAPPEEPEVEEPVVELPEVDPEKAALELVRVAGEISTGTGISIGNLTDCDYVRYLAGTHVADMERLYKERTTVELRAGCTPRKLFPIGQVPLPGFLTNCITALDDEAAARKTNPANLTQEERWRIIQACIEKCSVIVLPTPVKPKGPTDQF